jgi:hypothetical protein
MTESSEVGKKYLNEVERELVIFIEKFHSMAGVPPEETAMEDYLKSLGYTSIDQKKIRKMLVEPLFRKSLDARGIVIGSQHVTGQLSVRQMTAAAVMTNLIDRRSDQKKLQDLGISTQEWAGWMQDRSFNDYLIGRTERLLGNSVHEAHLGLLKGVRQGNVPAIKLLYEITNRYNPEQESQVNVRLLLSRFIEVIQKHEKDPTILQAIGLDLQRVALEITPTTPNVVKGEIGR